MRLVSQQQTERRKKNKLHDRLGIGEWLLGTRSSQTWIGVRTVPVDRELRDRYRYGRYSTVVDVRMAKVLRYGTGTVVPFCTKLQVLSTDSRLRYR